MKSFWKIIVLAVGLQLSIVSCINAATVAPLTYTNLGFLQGNIWYSKDPFYDGDKVRIYSAVFNSSADDLLGTAEFYDNDTPIGKMDFSVAGGGKIKEVWTDWQATIGNHKISAKIIKAQLSKVGGASEIITITNSQTGVDERVVDLTPTQKADLEKLQQSKDLAADYTPKTEMATTATADKIISDIKNLGGTTTAEVAKKMFDFAFGITKPVVDTINNFADTQANNIEIKKNELRKEIAPAPLKPTQGKAGTTTAATSTSLAEEAGFSLDSPLKSAYLLLLVVLGYILSHKILLYAILAFVLYLIIKFIFRLFSERAPPFKK